MANVTEYGLFQLMDLKLLNPNQSIATVDSGLLMSAIQMDEAEHNTQVDALLRLFAEDRTDTTVGVSQSGSARNQPIDENGRAIPVKPVVPYTVSFPIQGSGNAVGMNFVTSQLMTVKMFAAQMETMLNGDVSWVRDHILGAIFNNVDYSQRDPISNATLTVKPLANSDSVTYYSKATGLLATDTHFFATASAIADGANPYDDIYLELTEHPDNDGQVIAFIPTNLVATTEALTDFLAVNVDTDIAQATTSDRLVGTLGAQLPPSAVVRGKTNNVWIVEWPSLPSGYIVAVMSRGRRPLARRQFDVPALQGFRLFGSREDFPYQEQQFQRWEGYGALNRVGGLVYRIGNGSYAVPSNYAMPMP